MRFNKTETKGSHNFHVLERWDSWCVIGFYTLSDEEQEIVNNMRLKADSDLVNVGRICYEADAKGVSLETALSLIESKSKEIKVTQRNGLFYNRRFLRPFHSAEEAAITAAICWWCWEQR